jgi:hypothetical protein
MAQNLRSIVLMRVISVTNGQNSLLNKRRDSKTGKGGGMSGNGSIRLSKVTYPPHMKSPIYGTLPICVSYIIF